MLSRIILRKISPLAYQITRKTRLPPPDIYGIVSVPSRSSCLSSINGLVFRRYSQEHASGKLPVVDFDYVKKASTCNDVLIVDVREPDEIKEHGKIPNSVNIPLGTINATLSMPKKDFQETFDRSKPKENTEIIFYCMIGKRSGKAQESAMNLGYKNVKNYLGSWTDWKTKQK